MQPLLLWPAKFIQPGTISVRGTVLYRASSFTSCQPRPFYRGIIVRVQQRPVGDSRSERHSQLSARLAGVPQRFRELLSQWLAIDASLSFKTVWNASMVVLSRYRFKRSSNFMPRASTLLAWADVRVCFPSALMRVVAVMAFFYSIHSFLCNCGDRMERLVGIWKVRDAILSPWWRHRVRPVCSV